MPRGGARPGAGRKPKAIKYAGPVDAAERKIVDSLPHLVEAQLKLALGQVIVQDENPVTGELNVYAVAPDRRAGQYLLDRIMGKPTERIDLDADLDVETHAPKELDEKTRQAVRAVLVGRAAKPKARG